MPKIVNTLRIPILAAQIDRKEKIPRRHRKFCENYPYTVTMKHYTLLVETKQTLSFASVIGKTMR